METGKARTSAFNRIIKWIKTTTAKLLLHFVYYDNQLIKMNKYVNKEKKLPSERKSINLGYRNGETHYVWVQTKYQKTWCNSIWEQIVGFAISDFHNF